VRVYRVPGTYAVTLAVRDGRGGVDTAALRVVALPDRDGPRIRLWRPRARPHFLAGIVRDPSGVRALRVAVARLGPASCRWLTAQRAGPAPRSSCAVKHWATASIRGRRWSLTLPHRPRPGRYAVWLRASDRFGNTSRRAGGRARHTFRVVTAG
jgi:hypothetical protein